MKKKDLTTKQAAELLGCSEKTIRNMIYRGSLHARKMDPTAKSVYFIPYDEVEKLLKQREDLAKSTS